MRCRGAHDRLSGPRDGRAEEPVLHPPGRLHRRVHGPAGEADRRGDQLLQGQLRHAGHRAHFGAAARRPRARRASSTGWSTSRTASCWTRTSARSPTFVLDRPMRVKKGNWIAITVPTWAPMLAIEPAASGLVALLAGQGQLRAAREPAPVRDGGSARGREVRLHVPRRPAAVHRHVHTEQPRDERSPPARRFPFNRARQRGSIDVGDHRGVDLHGRLPRLRRRTARRVADLVLPAAGRRRRFARRRRRRRRGAGPASRPRRARRRRHPAAARLLGPRPRPGARPLPPAGRGTPPRPRAAGAGARAGRDGRARRCRLTGTDAARRRP